MKLILTLFKETYQGWIRSSPATTGAALSYYALFSLPAMLLVIVAVASLLLSKGYIEYDLMNQIKILLGPEIASTVRSIALQTRVADGGVVAAIVGTVTILIGSIGAFSQIETSLNTIWMVPQSSKGFKLFIWEKITAFFMIIWIGILLILSLITSTVVPLFYNLIRIFFPYEIHFIEVLNPLLSFFLLTLFFMSLYAFLPKVKISKVALVFGSIVTASLFLVGRYLIQTYLNLSPVLSAYGAASAIIGILLWAYYSSQVFLLGAAFTHVIDTKLKKE